MGGVKVSPFSLFGSFPNLSPQTIETDWGIELQRAELETTCTRTKLDDRIFTHAQMLINLLSAAIIRSTQTVRGTPQMDGGRSIRGWAAALTVSLIFTLVLLAVEKHVSIQPREYFASPGHVNELGASTDSLAILLTLDPGIAGTAQFARADSTPIVRRENSVKSLNNSVRLRRPPEPASNVVLQAPVVPVEMKKLPLHASSSSVDYLIDSLDRAFESPVKVVSSVRPSRQSLRSMLDEAKRIDSDRLASIEPPTGISGRIPTPETLLVDLQTIDLLLDPSTSAFLKPATSGYYASLRSNSVPLTSLEAMTLRRWVDDTRATLDRIVSTHGLVEPESGDDLRDLALLSAQAAKIGDAVGNYQVSVQVHRAGYGLERRVALWGAIRECLTQMPETAIPTPSITARQELADSLLATEQLIKNTGDESAWRDYLLLDELSAWLASDAFESTDGSGVALTVLSRMHWERLTAQQRDFLSLPEFDQLSGLLTICGRTPVDYRQLMANLEHFEKSPLSRVSGSIASTVQILRHSDHANQRQVAAVLNNHYRNANIRLTVSEEFINRFVPNGEYEIRPVRRRILGADTAGDTAIKTELAIDLKPSQDSWNIDLGVKGDLHSETRSSKGPAVFNNMSTAQIESHRYIKLNPSGYRVSSQPTDVNSQDFLRNFSTDFDGLPIVGDFVRLIVQEQFDQKRGIAQRITRRLIASETDAELDRRLAEGLQQAEQQLSSRLVGPLARMNLNPLVVSMKTSEDRLTVRYRVANELQMASFTPRPRAPSDNLMSMQVHESTLNNAIERMGLGGKDWTLPELYERLGQAFQQSAWTLPADVPDNITIRFAEDRPVMLEMKDGKLRLTLRIAQLRQGEHLNIERFVVSTNYVPVADGLSAELIRDGVVEVQSRHDRLALRVIFAKVFLSRPEISLIADDWRNDPRAEGLAVSQLDIRDGWLAVAISEAGSYFANQVAERRRELDLE